MWPLTSTGEPTSAHGTLPWTSGSFRRGASGYLDQEMVAEPQLRHARMRMSVAELGRSREGRAAVRARPGQRARALFTEACPARVVVLTSRASHENSLPAESGLGPPTVAWVRACVKSACGRLRTARVLRVMEATSLGHAVRTVWTVAPSSRLPQSFGPISWCSTSRCPCSTAWMPRKPGVLSLWPNDQPLRPPTKPLTGDRENPPTAVRPDSSPDPLSQATILALAPGSNLAHAPGSTPRHSGGGVSTSGHPETPARTQWRLVR